MIKKIIIANSNPIHKGLEERMLERLENCFIINKPGDLSIANLEKISPDYIFFPHWSSIIPKEIYTIFNCVVFHMTDLPFGRGGSPLQNLIDRGIIETKISALKVSEGIDTGDIYLKEPLALYGTAEEIFIRSGKTMENMIKKIIKENIIPIPQAGESVIFKRRKPEQSDVSEITDLDKLYDYIRMLDAEGYPKAYIETKYFRFEFNRASLKANNTIISDVRIIKK